jgi:hypothetical protein
MGSCAHQSGADTPIEDKVNQNEAWTSICTRGSRVLLPASFKFIRRIFDLRGTLPFNQHVSTSFQVVIVLRGRYRELRR